MKHTGHKRKFARVGVSKAEVTGRVVNERPLEGRPVEGRPVEGRPIGGGKAKRGGEKGKNYFGAFAYLVQRFRNGNMRRN